MGSSACADRWGQRRGKCRYEGPVPFHRASVEGPVPFHRGSSACETVVPNMRWMEHVHPKRRKLPASEQCVSSRIALYVSTRGRLVPNIPASVCVEVGALDGSERRRADCVHFALRGILLVYKGRSKSSRNPLTPTICCAMTSYRLDRVLLCKFGRGATSGRQGQWFLLHDNAPNHTSPVA
jgi:hypothetical protein